MRIVSVLFLVLALAAAPASAGTIQVYGLGMNGAGCPTGWQPQTLSPAKFRQGDFCSRWEIQSTRSGSISKGEFAGSSMYAPPGTRFTGFSMSSSGWAVNGVAWTIAMCSTPFNGCSSWDLPYSGMWSEHRFELGSLRPGASPYYAQHLWAGVTCEQTTCSDPASGTRAVQVEHRNSHAVLEDYTAPAVPSVSGVSTGWNSGQKTLSYSASDVGTGIESAALTVDGALQRTSAHGCARLPSGGYSRPVPCSTSTGGEFAVNEPGQLADGRHTLTLTTRDAGGEASSVGQEFLVDNNAPGHPLNLAVEGGDEWRASNDYSVTWENPDQGSGSPVAAAYYKIGSPPTSPKDGFRLDAGPAHVEAPDDGVSPMYVWLEDAAGNALESTASVVHLRLDTTPPSLAFKSQSNPHHPTEVRVPAQDATSGVASGQVYIRRQGFAEWQPLPTQLEGTELVATIPDDQLERGTYELRADASDRVGNTSSTTIRDDGQAMLVDLPLRAETHVNAGLARRAEGSGRNLPTIKIRYRRSPWLRGVLRSAAGGPLGDTRITVYTRPLAGGEWQPFTELVTDGGGRYAVQLPAGGSRELRVHFPGTRSLRPSDDVARLLVRGWAGLKLSPNRLRRRGTIAFKGHVGSLGASIPPAGKLIQIQYLDGRRWRPAVKLGRTDPEGHFRIKYRFRRISRPTRIYFRILVPAESGWPYATGASKTRIARVRP